jgi:type I restriction enzyme S subunit
MGSEWRVRILGELTNNFDGIRIPVKEADRRMGPYPYYGASGIVDYVDKYLFDGEYLLIAEDGENLRTRTTPIAFLARGKFWVNNHAHIVRGNCEADTRFLMYALGATNISGYLTGSTIPKLTQGNMNRIPLHAPALPKQRAIAHILGTLDDKIELNRRQSETLEAMARALFKSWFVDFDPVRAKAEGRDPGLPQPLADFFPACLVDSELGEIPEGWEVKPLPEIIEVNPPRTLRKGDVAPYLDMANMPKCGHTPDSVIDRPFGSGMRFMNGDTLVARITPCLENGKTAYVDFLQSGQVGWGSTEYIVLRPEEPLPAEFAYCLARSVSFRDFAIQSMTGSSGRQRVPAESLDHFLLPASPEPIARVFGRAVAPIFARASEAAAESRTLAALRDALLPKLISGALRVKDAEMFIANFVTVICTDDAQNQSSSL